MSPVDAALSGAERALLEAARGGDEAAFARLVERYRRELHAHCYRMLGSLHDAEDALQEALLRAWRALPRFEGRSSLRSWLYKLATNTSLDALQSRGRRALPIGHGPAWDGGDPARAPLPEATWIDPYPGEGAVDDGPDAAYEQRESLELAFVAAVQLLPARQRAALLMREVLGFSAAEAAEALDTSVPSLNSALQRARAGVEEHRPELSQQATLRMLGDEGLRKVVDAYMAAMQRGDVPAVVAMLTEDAAWSMPPLESWYRGADLPGFLANGPLSGAWRWKHIPAWANGQPAIGCYTWVPAEGCFRPFALDVLTLRGERIAEVCAFIVRSTEGLAPEDFQRWPHLPCDERRVADVFGRAGLPDRLA